jgi:hypothetical protein
MRRSRRPVSLTSMKVLPRTHRLMSRSISSISAGVTPRLIPRRRPLPGRHSQTTRQPPPSLEPRPHGPPAGSAWSRPDQWDLTTALTRYPHLECAGRRVLAKAYRVKDIIMSFNHDEAHGAFDRTEPLPLASPTMVLRTRREVREELERSKSRRSLLRRTMLPSFLCQAMGVLTMFHPNL